MPIGDIRDPYGEVVGKHEYHDDDGNSSLNMDLLLLGVAIAAVLVLVVVLYLHMRLRHEHALYEKDKGTKLPLYPLTPLHLTPFSTSCLILLSIFTFVLKPIWHDCYLCS